MRSFILVILFFPITLWSQLSADEKKAIDSIKYVIQTTQNDTVKVNAYKSWDEMIYFFDTKLDLEINQKVSDICEYHIQNPSGNSEEMLFYRRNYASSNNILGLIYENQGYSPLALSHHHKSLKTNLELQDFEGLGNNYNNLGVLYSDLQDTARALKYYKMALPYRIYLDDHSGIANAKNNIGTLYQLNKDEETAQTYFEEAFAEFEMVDDQSGMAMILFNMGVSQVNQKNSDSALYYFGRAEQIGREIADYNRLASTLHQTAYVYLVMGDLARQEGRLGEAKRYYELTKVNATEALEVATEVSSLLNIFRSSDYLAEAEFALGNNEAAFLNMRHAYRIRDSLERSKKAETILDLEYKFEYDLIAEKDSIQRASERKITQAKLDKEKTQRYALYGGIGFLALFIGFIFNRYRKSQSQKAIIEEQKELVEEKNQEIMDSINYAKRIQAAILPPQKVLEEHLPNAFVMYLPKDVVAGDFYWMHKTDKGVLIAAADCTGHGVPGAMVSVVCNNALNRSVKEFGFSEPGKILDQARDIVIEEFSKSEENVKDGMDIAMCNIEGETIKFAGAQNPLWIVSTGELHEIKGDKQPVGNFDHKKAFTTHSYQCQKEDMIYLFSDGFVDQFGGPKGKKFKVKALRELLLSISDKEPNEQHKVLIDAFHSWRGEHEQVDDVCLIGVRI